MQVTGNSGNPKLPGVLGIATATGDGVSGNGGATGRGVFGISANAPGIEGNSNSGIGVLGRSHNLMASLASATVQGTLRYLVITTPAALVCLVQARMVAVV